MSVRCWPRCRWSVGRHVSRVLAEMLVECRPRCRSSISRDVGQISAEMSVECRPRCQSSVGRDVGRVSVEISVEMSVEDEPSCQSSIGRDVGLVSAEMSVEYQPICRSSVGRDVGRVLRLICTLRFVWPICWPREIGERIGACEWRFDVATTPIRQVGRFRKICDCFTDFCVSGPILRTKTQSAIELAQDKCLSAVY